MENMHLVVDLRYVVPPLINLAKPWAPDDHPNLNNEIFLMACLFLAIATLLFLFISLKLPLTPTVEPLRLKAGDFSAPLTLSLLASLFLPSSLFWDVFPMLVILSPWYEILLDLLRRFIFWFGQTLRAIPDLIVICISTQRPHGELEGNNETNV
jgi:hypothetical protein